MDLNKYNNEIITLKTQHENYKYNNNNSMVSRNLKILKNTSLFRNINTIYINTNHEILYFFFQEKEIKELKFEIDQWKLKYNVYTVNHKKLENNFVTIIQ